MSLTSPDLLAIWEAQFGDFANVRSNARSKDDSTLIIGSTITDRASNYRYFRRFRRDQVGTTVGSNTTPASRG
jgi:hypothetical protein